MVQPIGIFCRAHCFDGQKGRGHDSWMPFPFSAYTVLISRLWLLALEWICQYTTLALFTTIAGMRVLTADYSKWDHMTCHLCQCHFSVILPSFRLCPPRAFFYPSNTVHDHCMPPSNPLSNAEPINLLQPLLWLKSFIAHHTAHLRRHNCIAFSRL